MENETIERDWRVQKVMWKIFAKEEVKAIITLRYNTQYEF